MKLYYFYTLRALCDGQGKIKTYYGMSRVKSSYQEKGLLKKRGVHMHFSKSPPRSKLANQQMQSVSIESTLLLFLLT